jgi:GR25 family glycosyltransferase involved in LPS biosynthesis
MFNINNIPISSHAFYINLDKSIDRHQNVESQIKNYNISNLERVSALTSDFHQSSATISHLKSFEIADKRGYDSICVFEDDFQLYDSLFLLNNNYTIDLYSYLEVLIDHINTIDWDVILLGFNSKKQCIPISNHLSKVFKSTGAWGYLINKKTYNFILNNFNYNRDRLAIDDILPYLTYLKYNIYATNLQLVHHGINFISTLQPSLGPINYTDWILGNYHKCIWNFIDQDIHSVHDGLSQIFNNSKDSRDTIVMLDQFDGDVSKLESFMLKNPNIQKHYCELIQNYDMPNVGYYLNVESPYLISNLNTRNNINNLGTNQINIVLD